MNQRLDGTGFGALVAGCVLLSSPAAALDLNGKWRFVGPFGSPTIMQVTQSGNMLSFGFLSGTVTAGSPFSSYSVSLNTPTGQAGIGGRIMPSENLLDGRGVSTIGGMFSVSGVVATRCGCDDGNTADGDGCDAECRIEPCWTCTGDPSLCSPSPDGATCDDYDPCTAGESCGAGACTGTPVAACTNISGTWSRHREIPDLAETQDLESTFRQFGTDVLSGGLVGTIDPASGAFDLRSVNLDLFCPAFDPLTGTVAPDGATYAATGFDSRLQPGAPDHCDSFPLTETGTRCIGPCPSVTSTTTTTTSTTTTTVPSGTACTAAPQTGCRRPVASGTGKLLLVDESASTGDRVTWAWTKGAATSVADFGAPTTTPYVACLYDGTGVRRLALQVPAGGVCGSRPCWKAKAGKGFTYTDKARTADGVTKLVLLAGVAGKAKLKLSAKGDRIPMPALGDLVLPLRMQLQGNGVCWEAGYGAPAEHSPRRFKARAD